MTLKWCPVKEAGGEAAAACQEVTALETTVEEVAGAGVVVETEVEVDGSILVENMDEVVSDAAEYKAEQEEKAASGG